MAEVTAKSELISLAKKSKKIRVNKKMKFYFFIKNKQIKNKQISYE